MASQVLVDYIKQNLQAGYDLVTLRNHLISNGYNEKDVDSAIDVVESQPYVLSSMRSPRVMQKITPDSGTAVNRAGTQSELNTYSQPQQTTVAADPQLVNYIIQQKNAGYTQEMIRQYLVNYGYPQQNIDSALDQAFKPATVEHIHKLHIGTIAAIGAVLLLVMVGSFFGYNLITEKSKVGELLDVADVAVLAATLKAGEELSFTFELANPGSTKRYDVSLSYEIFDDNDDLIISKEDTIGMETRFSKKARVTLPGDIKPGDYKIRVTATYDDQEATATDNFKVIGKEYDKKEVIKPKREPTEKTPDENITEEEQPVKPPAEEIIEENITKEEEDRISKLTPAQALEEVNNLKGKKITQARKLCEIITDSFDTDKCYEIAAQKTDVAVLCKYILDSNKRDGCYMGFVQDGLFILCDKLTDETMKQACEAQRDINNIEIPEFNITVPKSSNTTAPRTTNTTKPSTPAENVSEDEPLELPEGETVDIDAIIGLSVDEPYEAKQQCDELILATDRDTCYSGIAIKIESSEFCSYITDDDKKDECYYGYAELTADYTACELITDEAIKEECELLAG